MLELLSRYWWGVMLRGVAAILLGIVALIWPGITLTVLVVLFGAYALVDGVLALGASIFGRGSARGRRGWLALEGLAGVIIGVVTFGWPAITMLALLALISAWAVVTGVLEIATAVRLRREIESEWLLALSGALSVLFGILIALRPAAGAVAVAWLVGVYAIMFGAALVPLSLKLRRLHLGGAARGTGRTVPA
ncbi:MAG TPA: HdeD family acid-resistance protein [Kineosporiaceae bacterium]